MKLNKINEVLNSAKWIFGLLSSRNFATMATWRNDLSSLLYIEKDEKVRSEHKGDAVGEIRLTIWISKSNAKSKNEFRHWIERFSLDWRKTKTKVNTLANQRA